MTHSGGWPGYSTILTRYVVDDITVIVLSNNDSNSVGISDALADIVYGNPVTLPRKRTAIVVDEKILDSYVGVYEGPFMTNPKAIFTVTREANNLSIQRQGGNKSVILPETTTRFFYRARDIQIDFVKDDSGQVIKQLQFRNGIPSEAKKIK